VDENAVKNVLRQFPYGLYAITIAHNGEEHAMTANWVTQASFDPPMVVIAVENTSRTITLIRDARRFGVNLFHEAQRDLAAKLARSSETGMQKLKGVKTRPGPAAGVPILADALGWLECRLIATLPAGDHTLVLGQVIEAGVEHGESRPLTLAAAGLSYGG
jgi:flavin reductase (DIM6/NTAB) family NADH-FMN oxidoreductase RutF